MEIESAPIRLKSLPSWLLNQAALPAQRLVSAALGEVDAHRTHFSVLASLEERGPSSQAELTRRAGIDPSDMVALINRLTADGLVERATDPDDRRRNIITITAVGRRRLDELEHILAGSQDDLLAPLAGAEREELVRLLTRIVTHHAGPPGPENGD